MTRILPAPKDDFIGLEGKVHLATGGEPPLLKAHRTAFKCFAHDKAAGFPGYHRHRDMVDAAPVRLARWTALQPDEIALLANASEAIMPVVASIDWQAGDNVVVPELDYASGRYATASVKARGVELRLVPAEGWSWSADRLLDACDGRTRLVYISQVNALTGQHADTAAVAAALGETPTALMVDVSHALGAVPVRGDEADFLVSCCYKFALGVHEGILGWNRRRRPDFIPVGVGWFSATPEATPGKFRRKPDARAAEYGNVGHLGAYLLRESLDYLDGFGIEAIATRLRTLSGRLVKGMTALGLYVMTPAEPARRAASAAFADAETDVIMRRAAQDGTLIWGDNGRIRASTHVFTTDEDVATFLDRLPAYLGRG